MEVGSAAQFVTAAVALGVGVAAWGAWRQATRTFRYETIGYLLREYRTPEMGFAMVRLWDLYRECREDACVMIGRYQEKYREERDRPGSLHLQRRLVSTWVRS